MESILKQWEESNQLRVINGKNVLLTYSHETKTIYATLADKYTSFDKIYKNIVEYNTQHNVFKGTSGSGSGSRKDKTLSLLDQLKDVSSRLQTAGKSGIQAEKAYLIAKFQGEKEAAIYKKVLQTATITPSIKPQAGASSIMNAVPMVVSSDSNVGVEVTTSVATTNK
jgi:hypothetical protein